ncbi:hypothetical protein N9Z12_04960 [Opitutaceae bacterium]|nr:hypothetical protein [Opitutaceae bacterium]
MSVTTRALRATLFLVVLSTASFSRAHDLDPSAFIGNWEFDRDQSTDISPWSRCALTIALDGEQLTISRTLGGGRRTHDDVIPLDLTKEVNVVPQGWWIDNRHIGAYSPHNATKTIRARTLDDGKLLRLETDLVLETQQGPRDVNIISQYQISPDGDLLIVTDLRSTRPRPVVHVFKRISSPKS